MLEYNADIHKVITSNEEPAVLDGSREVFFSGTQFGKIQKFDRFLLKPADQPLLYFPDLLTGKQVLLHSK